MKRLIDSFIKYATSLEYQNAIRAWRDPSLQFYPKGHTIWTEDQWWDLTIEVVDSIRCRIETPDFLYDYISPILIKLRNVTSEIMPEPESFWTEPKEDANSSPGGMPQVSGSEAEKRVCFLRNELRRLGAIIQSALIEFHQEKDLFYYQNETSSCLLSGVSTYEIAYVRHWGYLHALKLTHGIQFQPASLVYLPKQDNRVNELKREICINVNKCDIEEINDLFVAVSEYYKAGGPFKMETLLRQCNTLRLHCEELAQSSFTLAEKTTFAAKILGTLSICYRPELKDSKEMEGIREVCTKYFSIIESALLDSNPPICLRWICLEYGMDSLAAALPDKVEESRRKCICEDCSRALCPYRKDIPSMDDFLSRIKTVNPRESDTSLEGIIFIAKDYLEALKDEEFQLVDEGYKWIKQRYLGAYAASIISFNIKDDRVTEKALGRIFDIPAIGSRTSHHNLNTETAKPVDAAFAKRQLPHERRFVLLEPAKKKKD